MTKFLAFITPLHGHINPTLAVVHELIEHGEEIVYYVTNEFKQIIEATGAAFESYISTATYLRTQTTYRSPSENPFINMIYETINECDYVISQIRDDVYAQQADYIIYDSFLGRIFAQMLQIPAIQFHSTYAFNDHFNLLIPQFHALSIGKTSSEFIAVNRYFEDFCDLYKLPLYSISNLLTRIEPMNIVFLPRIFQPAFESFDDSFKFVGASIHPSLRRTQNFSLKRLRRKPTLYISLGTIFTNQIDFVHTCLQAFANSSWQVIQSIGESIDRAAFEPIPENFLVYQHLPQLDILPRTDIFITHGGTSSVMEALYYGVPMIAIPQMPEQSLTAKKIVKLGLGIQLDKQNVTAKVLQEAVTQVNEDKIFRINAQIMQMIIKESGGYKEAGKAILRFIETNR
jgi:MGT family glycosyltransferase